jgi:hypothetical protein
MPFKQSTITAKFPPSSKLADEFEDSSKPADDKNTSADNAANTKSPSRRNSKREEQKNEGDVMTLIYKLNPDVSVDCALAALKELKKVRCAFFEKIIIRIIIICKG